MRITNDAMDVAANDVCVTTLGVFGVFVGFNFGHDRFHSSCYHFTKRVSNISEFNFVNLIRRKI